MPKCISNDLVKGEAHLRIDLSTNIADIESHFPGLPLIPAYMQLSWLENSVATVNSNRTISEFKSVKFIKKILPEGPVDIHFNFSNTSNLYKFKISRDNELLTSGSFLTNE